MKIIYFNDITVSLFQNTRNIRFNIMTYINVSPQIMSILDKLLKNRYIGRFDCNLEDLINWIDLPNIFETKANEYFITEEIYNSRLIIKQLTSNLQLN